MKSTILLLLMMNCFSLLAQEENDNIPPHLSALIYNDAVNNYHKITDLKKWMGNNGVEERLSNHHVLFGWPMRSNSNYDEVPNYYMIQHYVDQIRNTGSIQDWGCTGRSYNNHEGIDINLYPFWWRMKNQNNVFASAAAPGIVISVRDSINNENNCMEPGEISDGNFVAILHSDSSISRYYHIKRNSALVTVGQFVEEGKLLANIASSGRSSNPHLHFDVRDKDNQWIEPFYPVAGMSSQCQSLNEDSWWKDQKPYFEPQINRVATHSGVPVLEGYINDNYQNGFCPADEDPKLKNQFSPGDPMYIGVALHDVHKNDSVFYTIVDPNNNVLYTSSHKVTSLDFSGRIPRSYRTRVYVLPGASPLGTYTVYVNLKYMLYNPGSGNPTYAWANYHHYFTVGCVSNRSLTGNVSVNKGHIVSNSLQSVQNISGGKSLYQSANYIQLNPGFVAEAGATLKARIRNCDFSE